MRVRHFSFLTLIASSSCLGLHHSALARTGDLENTGTIVLVALPTTGAALAIANRDAQGPTQLASSLAVSAGLTVVLKYCIEEKRPNGGKHSFPSGHASLAFSAADFIRGRYGWKYGAPALAAATFVAYSRVASRQHYVHDVVAGAGIGVASSMLLTKPYKEWRVSVLTGQQTVVLRLWRHL
ncbi:MAG: phosphatase PAP2 family protein [candidate division KSB1 bacterium]|nr:phosphatase PAP2 family protein [candidate division KSB1 bacterium]